MTEINQPRSFLVNPHRQIITPVNVNTPKAATTAAKYEEYSTLKQYRLKAHGAMNTNVSGNVTFFKNSAIENSFSMLRNANNWTNIPITEKL